MTLESFSSPPVRIRGPDRVRLRQAYSRSGKHCPPLVFFFTMVRVGAQGRVVGDYAVQSAQKINHVARAPPTSSRGHSDFHQGGFPVLYQIKPKEWKLQRCFLHYLGAVPSGRGHFSVRTGTRGGHGITNPRSVIRSFDHSGPGRELGYGATKQPSGCSPLSLSFIGMARAETEHLIWSVFGLVVLLNF